MFYSIDVIDICELCSSLCFISAFYLIKNTTCHKKYHQCCLLGLITSSVGYHTMEKLYLKYGVVSKWSYELSTYLDNYFIMVLSGNILLSPENSNLIALITFKSNIFKKLYFAIIYLNTIKRLYFKNRIFEMKVSIASSILISMCIIEYSYNGWHILNSWIWHLSNLMYLITSCYSNDKVIELEYDCLNLMKKKICNYLKIKE